MVFVCRSKYWMRMDCHVLIVDDEVDLLLSVEYALKKEGFEVSTAETGQSAIAKALAEGEAI